MDSEKVMQKKAMDSAQAYSYPKFNRKTHYAIKINMKCYLCDPFDSFARARVLLSSMLSKNCFGTNEHQVKSNRRKNGLLYNKHNGFLSSLNC